MKSSKGISEATDLHGVTHYVRGGVRFVRFSKRKQRRNPDKRGHYVTKADCRWWCTDESIPANSPAAPGKPVDCMTCLVNPPEAAQPEPFTYSMFFDEQRVLNTVKEKIFSVQLRPIESTVIGRRVGRRR